MTVACVVVNFNGSEHTLRAVESLRGQSIPVDVLIVVDNCSRDDDYAEIAHLDGAVVLRTPENLGFAAGCNWGIRYAQAAGCRYVFLLNNDTWVESTAVEHLVEALSRTSDSVACPLIVEMNDPNIVWAAGGDLNLSRGTFRHRLKGAHRRAAGVGQRVGFASGCALMITADALAEVGLLPDRWFLYFEDTEYCAQLAKVGRTVLYVPQAVVQHLVGGSVGRHDLAYYYYWRNNLLFLREWVTGPWKLIAVSRVLGMMTAVAVFNLVVGRRRRSRLIAAAAFDALRGRWGMSGFTRGSSG